MSELEIKQIENLLAIDFAHLVKESKEDGFRFLDRLVDEYRDGINTFHKPGETLYGVYNIEGLLVAIGGLNINPFTENQKIGRLRRVYVASAYRRKGVEALLLNEIISNARRHFDVLVLYTDTESADSFYTSLGFSKEAKYKKSTHYLYL
ncbi:GNAT family N-acetyltransferase [Bacillus sp. FJAT-22090]|uniref:GNAT family N-acetyltransferase n=1 Tax=Bacillus sp. FJAT-22090 TaxID=1581038 RepID=UPI00119DED72|nr:GNAT family N-acetyltransferase [Bacillus sp. FJAT-22090]